jgi:hypothetical protein
MEANSNETIARMLKWNSFKCDEVTHANRIERGSDGERYRVITAECHKILYLWNSTGPDGAGFFTRQKVVVGAMRWRVKIPENAA